MSAGPVSVCVACNFSKWQFRHIYSSQWLGTNEGAAFYNIFTYLLNLLLFIGYVAHTTYIRFKFSASFQRYLLFSVLFWKQPKQIKHESNNGFHNMHWNCLHFSASETFVCLRISVWNWGNAIQWEQQPNTFSKSWL